MTEKAALALATGRMQQSPFGPEILRRIREPSNERGTLLY